MNRKHWKIQLTNSEVHLLLGHFPAGGTEPKAGNDLWHYRKTRIAMLTQTRITLAYDCGPFGRAVVSSARLNDASFLQLPARFSTGRSTASVDVTGRHLLQPERGPTSRVLRRNVAGRVFLIGPKDVWVCGVQTCRIIVSPRQSEFAGSVAPEHRCPLGRHNGRPHRIHGVAGAMHHDANGREVRRRSPCATQADIAVGVHCEGRHKVIVVGYLDETLLEQNPVVGPDFTPKYATAGVDGILGAIAGEDASAMRIDAGRAPGFVGA